MKTFMKAAVAAVALFAGGAASAATLTPDTFLGSGIAWPTNPENEETLLKSILSGLGYSAGATIAFDSKIEGAALTSALKTQDGLQYVELASGASSYPGFFVLKFGVGTGKPSESSVDTHYVFANIAELDKLVWDMGDIDCTYEGHACGLSHITVFDGDPVDYNPPDPGVVPLPATGVLLLGAIGGLAAVRKRRKAA